MHFKVPSNILQVEIPAQAMSRRQLITRLESGYFQVDDDTLETIERHLGSKVRSMPHTMLVRSGFNLSRYEDYKDFRDTAAANSFDAIPFETALFALIDHLPRIWDWLKKEHCYEVGFVHNPFKKEFLRLGRDPGESIRTGARLSFREMQVENLRHQVARAFVYNPVISADW